MNMINKYYLLRYNLETDDSKKYLYLRILSESNTSTEFNKLFNFGIFTRIRLPKNPEMFVIRNYNPTHILYEFRFIYRLLNLEDRFLEREFRRYNFCINSQIKNSNPEKVLIGAHKLGFIDLQVISDNMDGLMEKYCNVPNFNKTKQYQCLKVLDDYLYKVDEKFYLKRKIKNI